MRKVPEVGPASVAELSTVARLTTGRTAGSSLVIVPIPCASPSVALLGLDRFTKNVSSGSKVVSPRIETVSVRLVWPAVNVRELDFAV